MADQPWIKVPTVALDTFRELDKFRAYCELMSEADVLTRIVEVTVEGLARKYDWSWHKAKRFLSTIVSSGLGAVSSLNGEQTATPTATLQVDFSRFYEASRRPQRQRDGDPESPESDLHNMEHAPARGSILKELKEKEQTRAREGFDQFWKSYPRKVGKPAALKAFKRLNVDAVLLTTILKAIDAQKRTEQWSRDGGQYIPHPTTWLNQERWNDELPEKKPDEPYDSYAASPLKRLN